MKHKSKKWVYITIILCVVCAIGFLLYVDITDNNNIEIAKTTIGNLYQGDTLSMPKEDITVADIEALKLQVDKIIDNDTKELYLVYIDRLSNYVKVRDELNACFDGEHIISTVSDETISVIASDMNTLNDDEKSLLLDKYNTLVTEKGNIDASLTKLKSLFSDDNLTTPKDDVTRDALNDASNTLKALPQTNVLTENQSYLDIVSKKLDEKEEAERQRQAEIAAAQARARWLEAQRQAAIEQAKAEAIKKEQEEQAIQNAYVEIKGINIINQKTEGVYNGCEAAALLMALHYRGVATSYNLKAFAEAMPKDESDPHKGFVNSIYDLEPTDKVHWIAPDALALFGSTFTSTTDISGASTDTIKQYIDNNTPIIVYATYGFKDPTGWDNGVPLNLHVMLVVGYNKITGAYIIDDPWANQIIVKKEAFENSYNRLKYAVVVN